MKRGGKRGGRVFKRRKARTFLASEKAKDAKSPST